MGAACSPIPAVNTSASSPPPGSADAIQVPQSPPRYRNGRSCPASSIAKSANLMLEDPALRTRMPSVTAVFLRARLLARHVPRLDDPALPLPAKRADRCRRQCEQAAVAGGPSDPARGEDPQDVRVTEQDDVPAGAQGPIHDPVGARSHLLERLALRDRAGPDRPAPLHGTDGGGRASLVDAVVPFTQVVRHLRGAPVAREATGLQGTAERAREHERER